MSNIPRQIRRMRVGQMFSVSGLENADWWLRVPRGYRAMVDFDGVANTENEQIFYPLTDEVWDAGTKIDRVFGDSESARILAVLALSGRVPEEYR